MGRHCSAVPSAAFSPSSSSCCCCRLIWWKLFQTEQARLSLTLKRLNPMQVPCERLERPPRSKAGRAGLLQMAGVGGTMVNNISHLELPCSSVPFPPPPRSPPPLRSLSQGFPRALQRRWGAAEVNVALQAGGEVRAVYTFYVKM